MNAPAAITDFGQYAQLRAQARNDDPQALRAAAQQFEALFTQQLLKSMRAASIGQDTMLGAHGEMYQGLYDQQLSLQLASGKGLGIAEMLIRQLRTDAGDVAPRSLPPARSSVDATPASSGPAHAVDRVHARGSVPATEAADSGAFVDALLPHAEKAAAELGIPARVLVAQAALETGWGRSVMKNADGSSSNNFFGIKADARWKGGQVTATTREVVGGEARTVRAAFRTYESIEAGFADYVHFLKSNPRYADALQHGGNEQHFIEGLQNAGYATDPRYADKLMGIVGGRTYERAAAARGLMG